MTLQIIQETREKAIKIKEEIESKLEELQLLEQEAKTQEKNINQIADTIDKKFHGYIDKDKFAKFFSKPYALIPFKNSLLIVVPKFIKGFEAGWLYKETDEFFIYQLNQYSKWLNDVPEDILKEMNLEEPIESQIIDNKIYFNPKDKEKIRRKLGKHLSTFSGNCARITRGHEFNLIADMIELGTLPFKPKRVEEQDIRKQKSKIELRNYQKPALDKFFETGAIGLFHPTGAGKSFISLVVLDSIKGKKLVIVPTRSLVEQWNYLIEEHIPHAKKEIEIKTYQGFRSIQEEDYILTIFDECQKLPANTFSKLALINTKYRIGLSASPHREDKRESYIFALTGFPIGLNWNDYMKQTKRKYHTVRVHIVKDYSQKIKKVSELFNPENRTFIFSDSIDLGKQISDKLNLPFIFGETQDRLEVLKNNPSVVVSRVMDLGISVKDLKHIIEVDFLFGSRQQELQRTGRLMHSLEKDTVHDIIMTEEEFSAYGKRLWSLQEKGFKINMMED